VKTLRKLRRNGYRNSIVLINLLVRNRSEENEKPSEGERYYNVQNIKNKIMEKKKVLIRTGINLGVPAGSNTTGYVPPLNRYRRTYNPQDEAEGQEQVNDEENEELEEEELIEEVTENVPIVENVVN
jgi:hypothetical protein